MANAFNGLFCLERFGGCRPSEKKINGWIEKRGWTSNVPQASVIRRQWKPPQSLDAAFDNSFVQKMVTAQRWKGLSVGDVPEKGCGVFAKRSFMKGEVVCDYHGRLVSQEEGLAIRASSPDIRPGLLFFSTNKRNEAVCIDAHEEACQCHLLHHPSSSIIPGSKIATV